MDSIIKKLNLKTPINQIIFINIILYIIGIFISIFSESLYEDYIFSLSLSSDLSVSLKYIYLFITNGFIHLGLSHFLGNILIFIMLYGYFNRIEKNKIWYMYLSSIILCGVLWMIYLHTVGYEESILLGASGGIMSLISYCYMKWGSDIVFEIPRIKIRFKHILYTYIFFVFTDILLRANIGSDIVHLTGIFVGWCFSFLENKKSE